MTPAPTPAARPPVERSPARAFPKITPSGAAETRPRGAERAADQPDGPTRSEEKRTRKEQETRQRAERDAAKRAQKQKEEQERKEKAERERKEKQDREEKAKAERAREEQEKRERKEKEEGEEGERKAKRAEEETPERSAKPDAPWIRRIPAASGATLPATEPTFDLSDNPSSTIRRLEKRWQEAIKGHDAEAVDELLADDFVAISATGRQASKARILRDIRNDKNQYRSARVQKMKVRVVDSKTVVVSGIATEAGEKEDGEEFSSARAFTDTWKLRGERWQCVRSQAEALPSR